ncbi:ATPase, T2SS/T4P/T4SS family [Legionella pneumophila]|nr:ATPase, T2SS/T4P/T4SS family [Legionella pneumophila]
MSGGTSSGKTTFLNSCVGQIPLHERLITLEDTYEWMCFTPISFG